MSGSVEWFQSHGFNLPLIAGWVIGSVVSSIFGHLCFAKIRGWVMRGVEKRPDGEYQSTKWAERVGMIERPLYVFGVMYPKLANVITAVILFKAWFAWINVGTEKATKSDSGGQVTPVDSETKDKGANPLPEEKNAKAEKEFHEYVVGNLLSLLMGLAGGYLGLIMAFNFANWLGISGWTISD